MPDLQPNVSFYGQQKQPSLIELLQTIRGVQQLKTDQAISGAIQQNTDQGTGQTDWQSVSGQLAKQPNLLLTPGQMQSVSQASDAAIGAANTRIEQASRLMTPLLTMGNNITHAAVAAQLPALTQVIGARAAGDFAKLLKVPEGPALNNALTNLSQAYVGVQTPSVQMPGSGGVPGPTVSPAVAQRAGQGLATGAGGIASTEMPPELKAEQQAAGTFQERTTPLVNAIASARKLPPDATGPLSDEFNTLKKALGTVGAGKNVDWDKVDSYDKLKKALTQWSDNLSTGGTNDRLAQAIAGNPNMNMRNGTIQTLAKVAYAQEAKRNAVYQEYVSDPRNANVGFPAYQARMNQALDPRAFSMPMLSPQARAQMLKAMSPAERGKFERSWGVAKKYIGTPPEGGWYSPADEGK